ncbi:hypothetical protein [Huintestinicola sp.]|uniref:hypothetical protein n=1 Tax=Huintestinicola sp. TaxID=2981661 RepID=UPI003D7D7A1C
MKKKDKRSEEKKNGDIIDMLDSALDEDISEISEMSELEESSNEAVKPKNKSAFHFIVGLIFIILAAIGLISTVGFVSDKVKNIIDNTDQKNEFAKFIYPVVICDPPSFDATTKLKNETIISAAVWDIILYEDKSKYELDFDYLIVPEVDIEQHAAKLFGSGLTINHMTIASADISFYYDGEISSYRIPENPKFFTYSPYIESISKVGESYTLTVGYVSPTPAWLTLTSDEAPSPEKYVDYVVQKRGTSYTLVAIKQSEKQAENSHESGL